MAKLKNLIKQLSASDYETLYNSLIESNADKSAFVLKSMREKHQSDTKIIMELEVTPNAYYTLRSRLNQKIEEYLLQQMENPRADILKKVANINEVIFTKKKAIAIATLKKLEKELLDYDLSNELTIVYKSLKKLHIHAADYFSYSQSYNKHVAYTLAVDKAEDLIADYFKKYGNFVLTGSNERSDLELILLHKEIQNVCSLYESHRLYVYQSMLSIFHRLFVNTDENLEMEMEPIEDVLTRVNHIIQNFQLDPTYYHLRGVFEFLKFEYYNHYKVFRKAEEYYESVNESVSTLLTNYNLYTFPSQFLISKILRHLRMDTLDKMYEENEGLLWDYEIDNNDVPNHFIYVTYRGLSCYFARKYEEAARWFNQALNENNLKKYSYAQLEMKMLLALLYCMKKDYDLFNQLVNSIQRHIRILGKENCEHIFLMLRILRISAGDNRKDKYDKIDLLAKKFNSISFTSFHPTLLIKFDDKLISALSQ